MTKTFAVSIVLAGALGLSACNKSETANDANATNVTAGNAEENADNAVAAAGNAVDNAANATSNAANSLDNSTNAK